MVQPILMSEWVMTLITVASVTKTDQVRDRAFCKTIFSFLSSTGLSGHLPLQRAPMNFIATCGKHLRMNRIKSNFIEKEHLSAHRSRQLSTKLIWSLYVHVRTKRPDTQSTISPSTSQSSLDWGSEGEMTDSPSTSQSSFIRFDKQLLNHTVTLLVLATKCNLQKLEQGWTYDSCYESYRLIVITNQYLYKT